MMIAAIVASAAMITAYMTFAMVMVMMVVLDIGIEDQLPLVWKKAQMQFTITSKHGENNHLI